MSETVDATAYLTVEGTRWRHGTKQVRDAKVVRVTQGRPAQLTADQVAVRVTVRLPVEAFDPLRPEALIVVPEELVQRPVEVEATEGN
ncbi:hypothetical protein [Mycobacterium sp. 1245801.1]|uniref:hypothetical protein n=1 Tax=Mycobacterium sp. 1245801.1 TaxID=1834075 RepID=UPI0007FC44AD|nr:hypothetical protein [Mycobacterium sp. 1245801.1]OBJ24624.1 hypothetical protein A5622_11650 [Mycobacterium sp. 1245801.1]